MQDALRWGEQFWNTFQKLVIVILLVIVIAVFRFSRAKTECDQDYDCEELRARRAFRGL